jgi:alanyl-tRNA synthetase
VQKLHDERRGLEKRVAELEREIAKAAAGDLASRAEAFGSVQVLITTADGDLKELADRLRDQLGSSVIVLASGADDKAQLVVAASKDVAGAKVHAGKIVQELAPMIGGKGGGRPDLAQAGGKDASAIDAMLARARALIVAALA